MLCLADEESMCHPVPSSWFRRNALQSQSIFVPFGACAVPNQNLLYNCLYVQYIIIIIIVYIYIYIRYTYQGAEVYMD